jgi:putative transposase
VKGKRATEEQIIGVLKESEAGAATKELCRRNESQRRQEASRARG